MGMTSIWDNDFYNTPPQPVWAFEIDFKQYSSMTDNEQILASKAATTAKIAERAVELIPVFYGGVEFRHMARATTAGNLTIHFSENQNLAVYTMLNNLFNKNAFNCKFPLNTGNGTPENPELGYRVINKNNNICVKILKPDDNFVYKTDTEDNYSRKFIYKNCQIMTISEVDLDYSNTDSIVEYDVTFSYDYMDIESIKEKETVE